MGRPDITVVLATYNRAQLLCDALNSLMRQDTGGQFTYELLVVDDASTDATPKVVREAAVRSPVPVRYLQGSGKGMACAQNKGIKECSADWIAFFDDDEVADPSWLKELLACAVQTGAQVVAGAVRLLLPDEEVRKISPVCRRVLRASYGHDKLVKCSRQNAPASCNLLVKATVFQTVGPFNESMIRGGSDTEFIVRLRRAGIDQWFTPKAIVHHCVPAYRLRESYLLWCSIRAGDNFAYRDFSEWGLASTLLACVARIGQALLINFPLMLLAYILGNRAEIIGRKCLLMGAWGYLRESLYFVSPRVFSQEAYFSHLSMRIELNLFAGTSKSAG
jgi:succinoglycan biosynthesis protein ExoM